MPDSSPHLLSAPSRSLRAAGFAWVSIALLLGSMVPGAQPAAAQAPDIREIRPAVMLLIDTSGSMEYVGNCACPASSVTCNECLPDCGDTPPPRNRWANVLEVLTGEWATYSCTRDSVRRGTGTSGIVYTGQYDYDYYLPHIVHPASGQVNNGILDTYVDRVKFGLMTFDAHPTYTPHGALLLASVFEAQDVQSRGVAGAFSYAENQRMRFLGCTNEDRMVNAGARSEDAESGRLVSVGFESLVSTLPSDDHTEINQQIQDTLLSRDLRPHGATPIAAMLEDLEHYFSTHEDVRPLSGATGDPFRACRERFAILLTDGKPNLDYRGAPYFCEQATSGVPGEDLCPYDLPEATATRLTNATNGALDGLYVIGMNIAAGDTDARTTLNSIATAGGCPGGEEGGNCARFPTTAADLRTDFENIIRQTAPGTTTRTVPAFSGAGASGGAQHQFQTGFNPTFSSTAVGYDPWQGVLERRRYECSSTGVAEPQPLEDSDRFHLLLNTQATRVLYTALPTDAANTNDHLVGPYSNDLPQSLQPPALGTAPITSIDGPANTGMTPFDSTINAEVLGLVAGDNTRRDEIVAWTNGTATVRAGKRMGSIYHSSPVIIAAPGADRSDETFNEFRQLIGGRPRVLYVGTNDGILHAFLTDDYRRTTGSGTQNYTEGHEIWGFIPPILLDDLEDNLTGHHWMLDGTPVVQEVITARTGVGAASDWRTVLIMGFRQGANGYFALDVTDPFEPKFLWQYSHPLLGQTYGQPRMAQVNVEFPGEALHQRTVAILPGGYGGVALGGENTLTDARHIPDAVGAIAPRVARRNWGTTGRALFVVDVFTGKLIRSFEDFPSPLTGGVSVFPGSVGADAQAAYFNDHDGIIWRLDLSSSDPDDWDYQAIWDMAHGLSASQGEPAYNSPVLSTLQDGRVVIIQATGNVDDLTTHSALNRIVSLTETINVNATSEFNGVDITVNWDLQNGNAQVHQLRPGEQITGPLELFNGVVYFGTFTTGATSTDACDFGASRLWGLDYIENDSGNVHVPVGRLPHPTTPTTLMAAFDHNVSGFESLRNGLLMGVGIAARPRCTTSGEVTETDPYVGGANQQRHRVTAAQPPQFQLVAQLSGRGSTGDGAVATIGLTVTPPPIQVQTVGAVRRVE